MELKVGHIKSMFISSIQLFELDIYTFSASHTTCTLATLNPNVVCNICINESTWWRISVSFITCWVLVVSIIICPLSADLPQWISFSQYWIFCHHEKYSVSLIKMVLFTFTWLVEHEHDQHELKLTWGEREKNARGNWADNQPPLSILFKLHRLDFECWMKFEHVNFKRIHMAKRSHVYNYVCLAFLVWIKNALAEWKNIKKKITFEFVWDFN